MDDKYYKGLERMAKQLVIFRKGMSLQQLERALLKEIKSHLIRGPKDHLLVDKYSEFYFNYKGGQKVGEIKRGRMKKELLCRYCHNFFFAKKRYATKISEQKVIHERVCLCGVRVEGDETACEKFIPCERFWCDRAGYWLTPGNCLHRRETRHRTCLVNCPQFKRNVSLYIKKFEEAKSGNNIRMTRVRRIKK